jgi:hemerythrin-like domain-containing protein
MPKRHDALLPLTHDHHHALVQARALIGGELSSPDARREIARTFIDFYRNDTLLHFHEEEEELFPRLLDSMDEPPPELTRVLVEHVRIHGMVARLEESLGSGAPTGEELRGLGELLRAHVRFEENILFPLIEASVGDSALNELEFAARKRV